MTPEFLFFLGALYTAIVLFNSAFGQPMAAAAATL